MRARRRVLPGHLVMFIQHPCTQEPGDIKSHGGRDVPSQAGHGVIGIKTR